MSDCIRRRELEWNELTVSLNLVLEPGPSDAKQSFRSFLECMDLTLEVRTDLHHFYISPRLNDALAMH